MFIVLVFCENYSTKKGNCSCYLSFGNIFCIDIVKKKIILLTYTILFYNNVLNKSGG